MQENIIGPVARERLFVGTIEPQRKRTGAIDHVRVWSPVMVAESVTIENRDEPDANGVYVGRARVSGASAKKRTAFFPASWSQEKVEAAICEAMGNRVAMKQESRYQGQSNGLRIWLWLDGEGRLTYAQPWHNHGPRRRGLSRCECGRPMSKASHCPVGHGFVPAWMVGAYKAWKRARRRLKGWRLRAA